MKRLSQKGYSAAHLLLGLVIVGIIGFAGWKVYDASKETKKSQDNSNKNEVVKTEVYKRSTTVPKSWKKYTNKEYKVSFNYPAEWKISESTFNKKSGVEEQNVYSDEATKIFVICYKSSVRDQWCSAQININNQDFAKSVAQLRKYYKKNVTDSPYKETALTIDGNEALEFRVEAKDGYPAQKEYLINANGYTYGLTTVYEGDPKDNTGLQQLSGKETLALFESIKID
jgi:hypothetical protein